MDVFKKKHNVILDFKMQKAVEMMGGPKCKPFVISDKEEQKKKQRKHREARIDTEGNEVVVETTGEPNAAESLVDIPKEITKSKYPSWTKKVLIGLGVFVIVMGITSAVIFTPQSFKSYPADEPQNVNTPTGDETINTIMSFIPIVMILFILGAVMSALTKFRM